MTSTHEIAHMTSCPFSTKADIIHTAIDKPYNTSDTELFTDTYDRLVKYVNEECTPESDGIFIEVPGEDFGDSLDSTAARFKQMIEEFGVKEVGSAEEYLRHVETDQWQLEVSGTRFFVILFSPIYGEDHPRHSPDPSKVQLFFQPVSSFDNHIKAPYGTRQNTAMKQKIRQAFADSGRPYDENVANNITETAKYLKPLRLGEPAVKWWNY